MDNNINLLDTSSAHLVNITDTHSSLSRQDKIYFEQIRLIFTQASIALYATLVSLGMVCFFLWKTTSPLILFAWLSIAIIVTIGRFFLLYKYRSECRQSIIAIQRWQNYITISALSGGGVFGLASIMIVSMDSFAHQVFLMFVIGGMAAAAMSTLIAILDAYRIYALTALVPVIVTMFVIGGETHTSIAMLLIIFLLLLLRTAKNINTSIITALELGNENAELVYTLRHQATHDALTGLINRHEFDSQLQYALKTAQQNHQQHALIYMDLDQFKIVNDTCGHLAGDELLKQVAALLQSHLRKNDCLARLGGDEFAVIVNNCKIPAATNIADKILHDIQNFRFIWERKTFGLGISIGIATITHDSQSEQEIINAADTACYVAKDTGRNRIHVYLPDDKTIAQRQGEMQWIHRINHALENNHFVLYYQPAIPIVHQSVDATKQPVYCEFLIRMQDESTNIISPMAFIPAAERYQMMPAIDRWVSDALFCALNEQHPALQAFDIYAINLSGQTLCDESFQHYLLERIDFYHIDTSTICFEITETAAIANFQYATHFIHNMRERGCRFALDDFGSGLSSFAYLKNLSVDYLKIDGNFIKDIHCEPIDYAMVNSINQLSHVMGIQTIAEFVENDQILEKLRQLGVDYAQGYGIAKPSSLPMLRDQKTA